MQPFNHKTIKPFNHLPACLLLIAYCLLLITSPCLAQERLPTSSVPGAEGVVQITALETIFSNILTIATSLAGIAAFVVLIMGGFKWMTSGGDPKKMEAAKGSITYAFVGLACLVLIWFILRFISEFTGVNVTLFKIPKD